MTTANSLSSSDISALIELGMTQQEVTDFTIELEQEGITDLTSENLTYIGSNANYNDLDALAQGVSDADTTSDINIDVDDPGATSDEINDVIDPILDDVQDTAENGLTVAEMQAEGAKRMGELNAAGTELTIQYSTLFEEAQIEIDLLNLITTQALTLSAKAWESALLIAQYREKTSGMFLAIADQRSSNSFTRIKSLTQGFKF